MITSAANEKVKWARQLQEQRKARDREGLFVVEGMRLLEEALQAGTAVRLVLHTESIGPRERSVLNRLAKAGAEAAEVSDAVMRACSDTVTPQNLIGVLERPRVRAPEREEYLVVADAISNPGNLGSLMRSAEAFGAHGLMLAPGCVDAYSPKVVRGAMGAHFRLPIRELAWDAMASELAGFRVYLAEAREGERADRMDWSGRVALVVGGEGAGPCARARGLAAGSVHIPMAGGAESLNAATAGGILLFLIAQARGMLS